MKGLRGAMCVLSMVGVCLIAGEAMSANPYQAGKATFLIDGGVFSDGQANNLGPAAIQVLDSFWLHGACPTASDPTDYSRCDELQLGLTVYASATCAEESHVYVAPKEDGGAAVEDILRTVQTDAGRFYCSHTSYRPLDDGLWNHWASSFPGGAAAEEHVKNGWYDNAHMILAIVHDLPQTSDTVHDWRVIESLRAACHLHAGNQVEGIPSMPTWVMLARQFNHEAIPFAGLLAAAGGTGKCCLAESGQSCDPLVETLDVCAHLDAVTEGQIRTAIMGKRYMCTGGEEVYSTGSMDFGNLNDRNGTLPQIRCHLVGETQGDNCQQGRREPTDILGIMACVRQLPRGISGDEAEILYCPDDSVGCERLTEANGGIEFLDDEKTLFIIVGNDARGRDRCQTMRARRAEVLIHSCQADGEACEVPGMMGRCRQGRLVCKGAREVCEPLYGPMPEMCNGLDNDCDGRIDNLSSSSAVTPSLPASSKHLACNNRDVCVCPDGPDEHGGEDMESYLATWTGRCYCQATLSVDESAIGPNAPGSDGQVACQTTTMGRMVRTAGLTIIAFLFLLLCLKVTNRREIPTSL